MFGNNYVFAYSYFRQIRQKIKYSLHQISDRILVYNSEYSNNTRINLSRGES